MNLKSIAAVSLAVSLSAGVSICASVWLSLHWRQPAGDYLRAKRIEILDDQRRVRGVIGTTRIDGREMPQVVFLDEKGRTSVLLRINERGEGTLYFSSKNTEGKVAIGYVSGSDVANSGGSEVTDEENSVGAWGVHVLGPDLKSLSLAYGNTGQRFVSAQ
jgi:hypothetical protein